MDNKTLLDTLSKRLGIPAETVSALVDGLAREVGKAASELDSVAIAGFGSFEPRKRLERVAMHPATGRRLLVPPKIVLTFKPSTALKQKVRNGEKN